MSKMLAAVTLALPLAASAANASNFTCSPPTIVVGFTGKNPTTQIFVNRDVANNWKPGPRGVKLAILVTGDELHELKRFAIDMAEAFGLDRRIEAYSGKAAHRILSLGS